MLGDGKPDLPPVDVASAGGYARPVSMLEEPPAGTMEVRPPKRFSSLALVVFSAYGVLLLMPALFSMLIVSSVPFSWWSYVIPLVALAFATLLLPFGFGNTYAERMARAYRPAPPAPPQPFLVQITFSPRLRSGFHSLVEDADDIGWVSWTDSTLNFDGDSVTLRIPFAAIRGVRIENSGLRAMFLYLRLRIETSGIGAAPRFWIAERSSWSLPASRANGRRLYKALAAASAGALAAPQPSA